MLCKLLHNNFYYFLKLTSKKNLKHTINQPFFSKINIEFGVRKKIEQKKDSGDKKIFDEAYEKVFKLVESDSFTRFKQTMFEV